MGTAIEFENLEQYNVFLKALEKMPNLTEALKETEAQKRYQAQKCYQAALALVDAIEPEGASRLAVHWHDADGRLLRTLDEVVRAILADEVVL